MDIELLPAQLELLNSPHPYTLFVGGYGSGKTEAMLVRSLCDAIKYNHSRIAIYAPNYDQLRINIIPRFIAKLIALGISYEYNKTEFIIQSNALADVIFRSLNNPERIVGYEVATSHVDELDVLPRDKAFNAWVKVLARTRAVIDGQNSVFAYTTPEGLGFCYHTWKKDPKPGYHIVKGKTTDNPFLNPDYVDNLFEMYPENLAKAYINGEFCSLSSNLVYYSFSDVNVKHEPIKSHETLHIGMDFNITKMAAAVGVKRGEKLFIVDEFASLYDTPQMIQAIKSRYPSNPIIVYPDASGDNRSTRSSMTDHDLLKKHFKVRTPSANPRVRDRVNLVNGAFLNAKNESKLFISPQCDNLLESVQNQKYDDKGEPDKTEGFDHLNDALGYAVYSIMKDKRGVSSSNMRFY